MTLQDQQALSPRHRTKRAARRGQLVLALVSCLLLDAAAAAVQQLQRPVSFSPFKRLALAVSDAPLAVRADFAIAAVSEMVLAYRREAEQARQEARDIGDSRNPARWAGAVDIYSAELSATLDDVTLETPISVAVGAEDDVSLNIAGTPVIVSFPNTLEQTSSEQRVIHRFCSLHPCEKLLADDQAPSPSPRAASSAPRWSFSEESGPICATADGLEFHFQDTLRLAQKRRACAQVVAELNALALVMAENRAGGIQIDWNRLAIHALPGEERHRVDLDGEGSTVRLPLPALAATAKLFTLVRPWLAARVKGNSIRQVITDADRLMAPLINTVQ